MGGRQRTARFFARVWSEGEYRYLNRGDAAVRRSPNACSLDLIDAPARCCHLDPVLDTLSLFGSWGGSWIVDLNRPLGKKGGFGRVYEGRSSDGGHAVAVKLVETTNAITPALAGRELNIVEKLRGSDAKHLIRVRDAGIYDNGFFIVMERAERSLADALEDGNVAVTEVLEAIALGLEELHGLGVIHRDLKPPNILEVDGVWKLADFGIARDIAEGTGSNTFLGWGTPEYMAPEQWQGKSPTVKTDLYALGCLGYELLVGKQPFVGSTDEVREQHLVDAAPTLPDSVPSPMRSLIVRLLAKDPNERQQDARAVRERLARIVEGPTEVAARLQRIAAQHDEEVSEAESARLRSQARDEFIDGLRRQALADLEEIIREAHAELELSLPDVQLVRNPQESWLLRTDHGQLAIVPWPAMFGTVDEPNRFLPAIADARGANRRHNQALSLANFVCRYREGRLEWTLLRFRAQVGLVRYGLGPTDREHGIDQGHFAADYEGGLLPELSAMHIYSLNTFALTPDLIAGLFAEALEL